MSAGERYDACTLRAAAQSRAVRTESSSRFNSQFIRTAGPALQYRLAASPADRLAAWSRQSASRAEQRTANITIK